MRGIGQDGRERGETETLEVQGVVANMEHAAAGCGETHGCSGREELKMANL